MPDDGYSKTLKEFGLHVRRLREERGFSQESFAHEVGLHRTYIGSIERGERNVALKNIIRIATALGVDPGDLISGPK